MFEFPWAIPFPFPASSSTVSPPLSCLPLHPSPSFPATHVSLSAPSSSSSHFSYSILFFSSTCAWRARFNRRRCVMFLLNSVIFGRQTLIIPPPIYSPSLPLSLFPLPVRLHVASLSAVEVITNSVNRVIYRRRGRRTGGRASASASGKCKLLDSDNYANAAGMTRSRSGAARRGARRRRHPRTRSADGSTG